eukprot:gene11095-18710_t
MYQVTRAFDDPSCLAENFLVQKSRPFLAPRLKLISLQPDLSARHKYGITELLSKLGGQVKGAEADSLLNVAKASALAYIAAKEGLVARKDALGDLLAETYGDFKAMSKKERKEIWDALDADPRVEAFMVNPGAQGYRLRQTPQAPQTKAESLSSSLNEVNYIAAAYIAAQDGQVNGAEAGSFMNVAKARAVAFIAAQEGQVAHKAALGDLLVATYGDFKAMSKQERKEIWDALDADPRVEAFMIEPCLKASRLVGTKLTSPKASLEVSQKANLEVSLEASLNELKEAVVAYLATQEGQVASRADIATRLQNHRNNTSSKGASGKPSEVPEVPEHGCEDVLEFQALDLADIDSGDSEEAVESDESDKPDEPKESKELNEPKGSKDPKEPKVSEEAVESDEPHMPDKPKSKEPKESKELKESKEPKEPKESESSETVLEYQMTMLQAPSTSRELKILPPGSLAAQDPFADAETGSASDSMDDDVESLLSVMPVRLQDAIRPHSQGLLPLMEVAVDDGRDVVLTFVDGTQLVLNGVQVPMSEAMECLLKAKYGSSEQMRKTGLWEGFMSRAQRGGFNGQSQEEPSQAQSDPTRADPFSSDGRMGVAGTLHRQ